jgi:hypothetical protein
MTMRLSKIITISAIILFSGLVLFWGFLYWAMYSDINLFVNPYGALLLIVMLAVCIRYIAKSTKRKHIYILGAQYFLLIAVMTISNDIYRGVYYSSHPGPIFLGIADEPVKLEELYEYVTVFLVFSVPVPHWDWNILFALSVSLLIAVLVWFSLTIKDMRNRSKR